MAAVDSDGCRHFLHHHKAATAHVAAVGLQQKGALVAARSQARAVVEDAPVAAVRRVPHRVAAARALVALLVVAGDIAIAVHGDAIDDFVGQRQHAFLHLRKQALGQGNKTRGDLRRVAAGHGLVTFVEEVLHGDGTGAHRIFQQLGDLRCGLLCATDEGRVVGRHTTVGDGFDQLL